VLDGSGELPLHSPTRCCHRCREPCTRSAVRPSVVPDVLSTRQEALIALGGVARCSHGWIADPCYVGHPRPVQCLPCRRAVHRLEGCAWCEGSRALHCACFVAPRAPLNRSTKRKSFLEGSMIGRAQGVTDTSGRLGRFQASWSVAKPAGSVQWCASREQSRSNQHARGTRGAWGPRVCCATVAACEVAFMLRGKVRGYLQPPPLTDTVTVWPPPWQPPHSCDLVRRASAHHRLVCDAARTRMLPCARLVASVASPISLPFASSASVTVSARHLGDCRGRRVRVGQLCAKPLPIHSCLHRPLNRFVPRQTRIAAHSSSRACQCGQRLLPLSG